MATRKRHVVGKPRSVHVDEEKLNDLDLFLENTGELYPMKKQILANLAKKRKSGKYDPSKAPRAWEYLVDLAAAQYRKEFGANTPVFDRATRRALSIQLAKRYANGEDV